MKKPFGWGVGRESEARGERQVNRYLVVMLGVEMERKKAIGEKQGFWFGEEQKIA